MITIQVITKGINPSLWFKETQMKIAKLETVLNTLADDCVLNMIYELQEQRRNPARPDHPLEHALTVEKIPNGYGIGNISKLNTEAPHWELINDGGSYVTRETHAVPTTYFSNPDSSWITFKAGSQHTISPYRYIDIASEELKKHIEIQINNLLK